MFYERIPLKCGLWLLPTFLFAIVNACLLSWIQSDQDELVLQEELKAYMSANPNFVPSNVKTVLTKEEKNLKER